MAKKGALPVYLQICEMLIREIEAGLLLDGERLAPERQMAAGLNISVGTLRKSLAELERKGLLDRRQGSGNYIKATGSTDSIYAFFRLELHQGGGLPTASVINVERCDKPADLPAFGASPAGFRIRRLRRLDDRPVALEEIWVDGDLTATIRKEDLSESLYQYYKHRLGFQIMRVEDRIVTSTCPNWCPDDFPLEIGAPCGFIERAAWDGTDQIVERSRTWYDTRYACYASRLR